MSINDASNGTKPLYDTTTRATVTEVEEMIEEQEKELQRIVSEKGKAHLRCYSALGKVQDEWKRNPERHALMSEIQRLQLLVTQLDAMEEKNEERLERIKALLQVELEPLEEQAYAVKQRIAALRATVAPITRLPVETIASFFGHFVEDGGSPYRLRLVCRQWRRIANNHGQCWRRIKVTNWDAKYPVVSPIVHFAANDQVCTTITEVTRAIAQARNSKLIISIDFRIDEHWFQRTNFPSAEQQVEVLTKFTSKGVVERWESFSCELGGRTTDRVFSDIKISARLNLQYLSLSAFHAVPLFATAILSQLDSVEHLSLEVDPDTLKLLHDSKGDKFWKNIERLDVESTRNAPLILRRCTQLQHLSISKTWADDLLLPSDLSFPILESYTILGNMRTSLLVSAPILRELTLFLTHDINSIPSTGLSLFPLLNKLHVRVFNPEHVHELMIPQTVTDLTIDCEARGNKPLMEIFDGTLFMPRPPYLTVISNASGASFLHVMRKSPQLEALTIITKGIMGKSFWEGICGKKRSSYTLCPELDMLAVIHQELDGNREQKLDIEEVDELAHEAADTRDDAGCPLSNFFWVWTDGSTHIVRSPQ